MFLIEQASVLSYTLSQESADNVDPDTSSTSKDALLEEACRKYDKATRLCPTLQDVCFFSNIVNFFIN